MGKLIMTFHSVIYYHDSLYQCVISVCVCVYSWNLPGPDNYALQYADGVQTYITESVSRISTQIFIYTSESVR